MEEPQALKAVRWQGCVCGDNCYKWNENDCVAVEKIESTHKEAVTRLSFHPNYPAMHGFDVVKIVFD